MQIWIIAAIIIAITASVSWLADLRAENTQLQADIQTASEANQTYQNAMHAMAQEQVRLNQQIIERDQSQRQIQRHLATTQRRLRDASHSPAITDIQRQCLDMDIPGPVLGILRAPANDYQNQPADSAMPGAGTLLGRPATDVPRQHLAGSGGIRRGVEIGRPATARGPTGNSGFLQ